MAKSKLKRYSSEEKAEILKHFMESGDLKATAKKFNVHHFTIKRWTEGSKVKKAGKVVRRKKVEASTTADKASRLFVKLDKLRGEVRDTKEQLKALIG